LQCSVYRGGAHRQQIRPQFRRELQVAMPFHGIDQNRQQGSQPLAADPVRSLPHDDQRFTHRLVVDPSSRTRARLPAGLPATE